jgi:hypothetical protein
MTEHIAYVVGFRNVYVILVRKAEGQRKPCPGADRRIILTLILRKWDIKSTDASTWLRTGSCL